MRNRHFPRYKTAPKATREGPALSRNELDQREGKMLQFYKDGVPFFDMGAIRLIGQQLVEANKGGPAKIPVTGLDDIIVNFEFEVGDIVTQIHSDLRHLV